MCFQESLIKIVRPVKYGSGQIRNTCVGTYIGLGGCVPSYIRDTLTYILQLAEELTVALFSCEKRV
jgi:hypothetical protein